jgi:hypothetical protein
MSHTRRFLELCALFGLAMSTSLACSDINTPIYLGPPEGMPSPILEIQGTEMIPRVTNNVTLRYRAPNTTEQAALDSASAALKNADPMHREILVPWVARDKIHLEVLFTVKNLDTDPGMFDVVVDGANQYTKYDENVVAAAIGQGNDKAVYLPLLSLHPMLPTTLAPGATYQGVMREDDFAEAEADLDAMGRWMAPFASVLINRSDVDPVGLEMVPPNVVTPALVEVDVTLTADKHMTCEWTLRVRDDDDRLWHVTGDAHFHPTPTLFEPMLPPKT